MCIILDTNCFAHVFKRSSEKHPEFKPVLYWVINGNGKFVFGGTKYLGELKKTKYLKIFGILNKYNKVIKADDEKVDKEEEKIKGLITHRNFDDQHLPSIVRVTSCMLICSEDKKSIPFVTLPRLYPKGISVPRYYTSITNKNLLCDRYIPKRYKPMKKINKPTKITIEKVLENFDKKKK